MPTGDATPIAIMPGTINIPVPTEGIFITTTIQSDGTAEKAALVPGLLQELIDVLQEWEGRDPGANVTGTLYEATMAPITPTDPIPLPDPPVPEPS